jgi:hypothetical protein
MTARPPWRGRLPELDDLDRLTLALRAFKGPPVVTNILRLDAGSRIAV